MAYEVVVPRLGLTMEEASIVAWYKDDGQVIEAGEPLFAVETDKTVQDVEALTSGIFWRKPNLASGPLPIGTVIGYILAEGEQIQQLDTELPPKPNAAAGLDRETPASSVATQSGNSPYEVQAEVGGALRRANGLKSDRHAVKPPDGGPVMEGRAQDAAKDDRQVFQIKASPLARRLAKEAGIDLTALAAQKQGKSIQREDVEALIAASKVSGPGSDLVTGVAMPMTQIRRITSERMAESARTVAPVTLTTEADATAIVARRDHLKKAHPLGQQVVPSYNDMIMKLTAGALQEHPMLNARLGDNEIVMSTDVHIAMAIDTDAGLLVPVIRNVPAKSLQQVAEEMSSMIERARAGRLQLDELQGATFTITNLGGLGIDFFTPLVNLPQCAILGIGRIIKKPAVQNEEVVSRERVSLSLTFDHRVVDGGPAARFLDLVRKFIEQPPDHMLM